MVYYIINVRIFYTVMSNPLDCAVMEKFVQEHSLADYHYL